MAAKDSTTPYVSSKYGAALSAAVLFGAPMSASAAIVNVTFNINTVAFGGSYATMVLIDGSHAIATWTQFNDGIGKSFGSYYGARFFGRLVPNPVPFGSPISNAMATVGIVHVAPSASGTYTFGFTTVNDNNAWVRINLGGPGGSLVYLAAAYNTVPFSPINAGQTASAIPETSTTIAMAGLAALAVGVVIDRKRKKRTAALAAE